MKLFIIIHEKKSMTKYYKVVFCMTHSCSETTTIAGGDGSNPLTGNIACCATKRLDTQTTCAYSQ